MQPRVMITNGGDHPADKWAEVTAQTITDLIQIDEDNPGSPRGALFLCAQSANFSPS